MQDGNKKGCLNKFVDKRQEAMWQEYVGGFWRGERQRRVWLE